MDLWHLSKQCDCAGWVTYTYKKDIKDLVQEEKDAFTHQADASAPSSPSSTVTELFPFMELPIEVRSMIYEFHFLQPVDGDTKWRSCPAGESCPLRRCNDSVPVRMLCLVSKAVYEESMPIYFRTTTFCFLLSPLSSILAKIRPQHRRYVTKIVFRNGCLYGTKDFLALQDCPSLKDLTIIFHTLPNQMVYNYSQIRNNSTYQHGLQYLLQIKGLQKLTVAFSEALDRATIKEEKDKFVEILQKMKQPYAPGTCPEGPTWKLSQKAIGERADENLTRKIAPIH